MYCPNCGQQQVSDEMRFCSRCGLALSELVEWLAGRAPLVLPEEAPVDANSPRRKAMRRAAKLMFFSGALFPLFLLMSIAENEPGPMAVPFFLFFASLMWMLYARLFRDKTAPVKNQTAALNQAGTHPSAFGPAQARGSLPPATTTAIPTSGRQRVRTNELYQPPSVTDHTTKLLDNE
jgi:endogenous inhibitor of DNA gyrase (YacG/DUF329 family)